MRRGTLVLALALALAAFIIVRWSGPSENEHYHPKHSSVLDVSPVCPWREPQRDLLVLFPPATNYVMETRILSGMTVEIKKRLGRHMTTDENPLRIYRVRRGEQLLGSVLVTRVKAEHGGIEIVTGVERNGAVRGVLIQSQREPADIAQVITNASFLASFVGKTAASPLRVGEDLPAAPAEARASAQAIADGVRSELIVFSFAEMPLEAREFGIHTNH